MSEQRWEMTRGARRAVVFLFVLSFVLAAASFAAASHEANSAATARASAAQAKAEAASARAEQLALCRAGNEARAEQVNLWEFVIRLSPARSARQRAVQAEFVHHLHAIFAPRDCAALGRSKP